MQLFLGEIPLRAHSVSVEEAKPITQHVRDARIACFGNMNAFRRGFDEKNFCRYHDH